VKENNPLLVLLHFVVRVRDHGHALGVDGLVKEAETALKNARELIRA